MPDSVLTVSCRAMLTSCEALGLDTRRLLQNAGLNRAMLDDPDTRIELEKSRALWQGAYALSRDPDLALHAAESVPFGAFKVIDYLATHAATMGDALCAISRYFPIINTAVELPVDVGPKRATIGIRAPRDPDWVSRPYVEFTFACIVLRTRVGTSSTFPLVGVEIAHPPPPSATEHQRIFRCPVRFGAPESRIVVDRIVWDSPTSTANRALFQVLQDHAAMLLDRLPAGDGFASEVRVAIADEMRGGDPSLKRVARRMAMSTRTLQRRLQDIGQSYGDLVDETRRTFSVSYLEERDIALSEVAFLLGFAEQSSFTRAFKRWTGQTPSEYRAAL